MKFIFKICNKPVMSLDYPVKWQDIEPILETAFPDLMGAHYVAQELAQTNNTLVRYECDRFFTIIRPLTPKEKAEAQNVGIPGQTRNN